MTHARSNDDGVVVAAAAAAADRFLYLDGNNAGGGDGRLALGNRQTNRVNQDERPHAGKTFLNIIHLCNCLSTHL